MGLAYYQFKPAPQWIDAAEANWQQDATLLHKSTKVLQKRTTLETRIERLELNLEGNKLCGSDTTFHTKELTKEC